MQIILQGATVGGGSESVLVTQLAQKEDTLENISSEQTVVVSGLGAGTVTVGDAGW